MTYALLALLCCSVCVWVLDLSILANACHDGAVDKGEEGHQAQCDSNDIAIMSIQRWSDDVSVDMMCRMQQTRSLQEP